MNLFKKEYIFQGMVQFDKSNIKEPVICGDIVRWLDEVSVKAYTKRKALNIAIKLLNEKYSQYKKMVQIY